MQKRKQVVFPWAWVDLARQYESATNRSLAKLEISSSTFAYFSFDDIDQLTCSQKLLKVNDYAKLILTSFLTASFPQVFYAW